MSARGIVGLLLGALVVSCTAARDVPSRGVGAATAPRQRAVAGGAVVAEPCSPPPPSTAPYAIARSRAVDALLSGQPNEAAAAFERVVRAHPRELASAFLHSASIAGVNDATSKARSALPPPVRLAPLPLKYTLANAVDGLPSEPVRLHRVSEGKNLIVDDADWFKQHDLAPPSVRRLPTELPEHVARSAGGVVATQLFVHADHHVALYGNLLGVFAAGRASRLFDVSRLASIDSRSLEIDFAQAVDDVLLVQVSINGYSREVGGRTGFVAALGLSDGQLRWCSEPLVANAHNFLVLGGSVVTGYGFTAEPDHLFVLDLRTGAVTQKTAVRSGPDWILAKGDRVHVRTYDTNYVFRAEPPAPAEPAPRLSPSPTVAGRREEPTTRCWVDTAIAAIDRRDPVALERAVAALERGRGRDDALVASLEAAQQVVDPRARGHRTFIDLTTQDVIVVPAPPWEHAFRGAAPGDLPRAPTLVKRSGKSADPVRGMPVAPRTGPVPPAPLTEPVFIPPVDRGRLPPGVRPDIPSSYGFEDLRGIFPDGERILLDYGGRYLAIVRGMTTERVFDLEALRHPPRANPQWKEFAIQDISYAKVDGGVLYVANGGGSYAKEVFGKKGFVTALDASTGALLWRSQPLVAGGTFALVGHFLVSGYGFTEEPDFLYVLRRADGRVVARAALESAPGTIRVADGLIHVEAYSNTYVFELVP